MRRNSAALCAFEEANNTSMSIPAIQHESETGPDDQPGIGLYVHIPFCQYKCTFCDFATFAGKDDQMDGYVEALLREIALRTPSGPARRASTVFFGGGTPSLLPAAQIGRILDALRSTFALDADAEVTLEANPGNLNLAAMCALRAAGVTRLSVGVQSLSDRVLAGVNRLHSGGEAIRTLETARQAGLESVSADLMFGLPGQERADWEATLRGLVAVAPDHLSVYGLILEPGTMLRRQVERGTRSLPPDDDAADMYEAAQGVLSANGYVQYEVSNWARHGHRCRHNLTYWLHRPYLGFGLSAHSYFAGARFANLRGLQSYRVRLAAGKLPTASSERIDASRARADAAMLGLRLVEGIHAPSFDARFGGSLLGDHRETIDRLAGHGLVEVADDHLRLTPRGYLLANQVWMEFV